MSRQRLLIEEEDSGSPVDDLLSKMAGVFRWKADGSWWSARVAGSSAHGFGPTPTAAMQAALEAHKPRRRETLE